MSADATATSGATTSGAHDRVDDHHGPTDKLLYKVAAFLAAITALEVAWSYLPWSDWGDGFALLFAEVGGLLIMMAVKFFVVAWYFMHLKFDSQVLTRVFYAAIALAVGVYVATLATFELFGGGVTGY